MNYKHLIKEVPLSLTILPTHKCTAQCESCCFGCSPKINYIMPYEEIIYHIDQSLESFPSLTVFIVTGGECFLLGDDLDRVVSYASQKGLITRIVTNAYWATTYEKAYDRLSRLKQAGLCELNISTGKNHQRFVDQQNIINAAVAATAFGFSVVHIWL